MMYIAIKNDMTNRVKTTESIDNQNDNSNKKVILSLFDYSGSWSKPYRDAGYDVVQVDLKLGDDIFEVSQRHFFKQINKNKNCRQQDNLGIKKMTKSEEQALACHNLMILICNWDSSIIEKTWGENDHHMAEHFKSKFAYYCSIHGGYASANAILAFYFSLSDHYKKDLCFSMVGMMNWRNDFTY